MFTFFVSLFVYIGLLNWSKRYQKNYMIIHNMTEHEYNVMIKEKMKNYSSYEYSELHLV